MRLLVLALGLLLIAGCPGVPAPDDGGQAVQAPAVEVEVRPATGADGPFQDLARAVASRTGCRVVSWGVAPVGDDGKPRRFAVLEPDDPRADRGAYLIEDRAGRVFRVSYQVDGRTLPWGLLEGESLDAEPVWQARTERAVTHAQGHHRGGESIEFALRKGALVVLVHEFMGDAEREVTERAQYAIDGVCQGKCPALAGFATEDALLEVSGPAASAEALVR